MRVYFLLDDVVADENALEIFRSNPGPLELTSGFSSIRLSSSDTSAIVGR